jgi:penicillin-binding protein 2
MDPFKNRRWVIILIITGVGIIFSLRLFYIQVINHDWSERAAEISLTTENLQPPRGFIYDRNYNLLVGSATLYDIFILPIAVKEKDTVIICDVFNFSRPDFREILTQASTGYNVPYKPSVFIKSMSQLEHAKISPFIGQISAIHAESKLDRGYPFPIASHLLGYIRRIDENQFQKTIMEDDLFYTKNDFIGITGLENQYEKLLRGERGNINYLKDYAGNKMETVDKIPPKAGKSLLITLDAKLQKLGEDLMKNKIGSIVALEPSTGEVLAMISAPSYNPSLLTGRNFANEYKNLKQNDSLKPLINRPIYNDKYRPGSIFKLVQALVALDEGVITKETGFACNKKTIGCHNHEKPNSLLKAIKHSCNPYFFQVYKRLIMKNSNGNIFETSRLGLRIWEEKVKSFGFGSPLGIDLPDEKSGFIPNVEFYDRWYGKKRWAFSTIYSNSIGEGEIGVSPIQMANLAAIIANKGFYYTPHLVKKIEDEELSNKYKIKHYTDVSENHFEIITKAMNEVVNNGTGRNARIDSIEVCGKTGTVENKNFNDHSVFISFAPMNKPKIAIAVYVEYGTWGSKWAQMLWNILLKLLTI